MKIGICGAGVAGPTLAHFLLRAGHEPVLIEEAAHFRSGGYVVDFWGVGYDVAERTTRIFDAASRLERDPAGPERQCWDPTALRR